MNEIAARCVEAFRERFGGEPGVVVQAPGVTLVCPKDRVQEVKAMVAQLRATGTHDEVL